MAGMLLYAMLLYTPLAAAACFYRTGEGWAIYLTLIAHLAWFCLRPAACAVASVTRERELGTWEALCCTLLTPGEIYASKLRAALWPLLPCLVVFPTLFFFCERIEAVPLVLLSFVYAWFSASLGLYASLHCATSLAAGRLTWGVLSLVGVAPLLLVLFLEAGNIHYNVGWVGALCPVLAWLSVYLTGDPFHGDSWWMLSLGLYALAALGLMVAGLRLTARPVVARPAVRRSGRDLSGVEDAIAYRAACSRSTEWLRLVGLGLVAVGVGRLEKGFLELSMGAVIYLCIRAVAVGVGAFAGEREKGTLAVLLASPLRVAEIVRAKARVALAPVVREWLVLSLGVLVAGGPSALSTVVVLLASTLFFGWLGLWCSARSASTLKAAQQAYFVLGFLGLMTFWLDVAVSSGRGAWFMWVNPLMAAMSTAMPEWQHSFWPAGYLAPVCSGVYFVSIWVLAQSAERHLARE